MAIAAIAILFAPQLANAKPYGVFSNSNPTTYEPLTTIVFHNDDSENPDGQIISISDDGRITDENSRNLMAMAQVISFLPEFYLFEPTNIAGFFQDCSNLERIENLEYLNTGMVTDMSNLFLNCSKIKEVDLSMLNTDNATLMSHMFHGCTSLVNLKMDGWNTSNVRDFSYMFYNCDKLEEMDLSKFGTYVDEVSNTLGCYPNCTNMMANCTNLKRLALSPTLFFVINNRKGMENDDIIDNGDSYTAFDNVGKSNKACLLFLPSNDVTLKLMGNSENAWADHYLSLVNNIFSKTTVNGKSEWSGGVFKKGGFYGLEFYFGDEFPLGDANHDESMSITDIMKAVNYILGFNTNNEVFFYNADVNKTGVLSVADIMTMINMLLTSTTTPSDLIIDNGEVVDPGDCDAPASNSESNHFDRKQLEYNQMVDGQSPKAQQTISDNNNGHQTQTKKLSQDAPNTAAINM